MLVTEQSMMAEATVAQMKAMAADRRSCPKMWILLLIMIHNVDV